MTTTNAPTAPGNGLGKLTRKDLQSKSEGRWCPG